MDSVAITDHGNMFGAVDFYTHAKAAGIKPILGMEAYIAPGSRLEKQGGGGVKENAFHLLLLAENMTGYQESAEAQQYRLYRGLLLPAANR